MFIFQPDTTEWTGGVAPFKISLEGQNAACFKTTVPSSQPSSCITKCQILVWEKPIRTQLYRLTWSAWISSTGIFTLDKMQVLCGSPGEITTDGTSKAFCRWNQPPSGMFHSKLIDSLTSVLPFVWSWVICSLFWDLKALFWADIFLFSLLQKLEVLCRQSNWDIHLSGSE